MASWMEARFEDIEGVLLTRADAAEQSGRRRWLDVAERSLEFYTAELRRLEDMVGRTHTGPGWPHQ